MRIKDKVYGNFQIEDPLVKAIIQTKAMQRLKGINQYGTHQFLNKGYDTTRLEHSIGVYILLNKLGANRNEQIAGLIHDISHTAFSHVIDFLYNKHHTQDVHENFFEKVIKESEIPDIVKSYGLDIDYLLNESNFPLLEKNAPDLCADRLDYFFRDAITTKMITQKRAVEYLNALTVYNDEVVIKNKEFADEIANKYMSISKSFWGDRFVVGSFRVLADAFKLGLKENIITEDDFFLTDSELIKKLKSSDNGIIHDKLDLVKKEGHFSKGSPHDYDMHGSTKARYINPKFISDGKLKRLSDTSNEFKSEINKFKKIYKDGFYIKFKK